MNRNHFILAAATVLLVGCVSDPLPSDYPGYSIAKLDATAVSKSKDLIMTIVVGGGYTAADYEKCAGKAADATCVSMRNRLVSSIVLGSEDLCIAHRRSMYGKDAFFNITSGTFTNLFAGWATLAPGEHGKSILSALALFSNSERSLVNETVYRSVIIPAVDKKIVAMREEKAITLARQFTRTIDDYPLALAVREAIDFHYSCSFINGLEKALEEGVQETPTAKAARLVRTQALLKAQIEAIPVGQRTAANFDYAALKARFDSLNDAIRDLEKQ